MSSGILGLQEKFHESEEVQAQDDVFGGEDERGKEADDGDRSSAGNRWPHEETLALLKIRSDMDVEFRDSGQKGPLWEEVSRKLSEFGFRRSAKKCKEKFENIDKYYRRTKEGKSGRPNGKNYRFFEQLEALHHNPFQSIPGFSSPPPPENGTQMNSSSIDETTIAMAIDPINIFPNASLLYAMQNSSREINNMTTTASTSTNSTSTEGGISKKVKKKEKRKYNEFFDRLIKEVTEKQENLQRSFVEAIERYERDRVEREEAWRIREMARLKREHEMLVQERKIAAAKDAAVMAFLQKFSQQEIPAVQLPEIPIIPFSSGEKSDEKQEHNAKEEKYNNIIDNVKTNSSSRWPKSEVEALINIRSTFGHQQIQDNGTKGSLWEEISLAMKKLGYERSAKRCKEKWENINKYFKRVRDSNKKRPEDSRTCPYFHQLNALYNKEKNINDNKAAGKLDGENNINGNQGSDEADNHGEDDEQEEEEDGDNYQIVVNNDASSMKARR